MTKDMLLYQPHHKDAFMPLLHVQDVRTALRCAFEMPPGERQARAASAAGIPGPDSTVPRMISAISAGWRYKEESEKSKKAESLVKRVCWEGSQFVHHSLALVNRELCLRLIERGCEVSIVPYERDQFTPEQEPRFRPIAERTGRPLPGPVDVHVRHQWPPNFTPPTEGHWVIIQPWEFGSIPREWVRHITASVDEVWVPSRFVRDCYIRSGVPAERVFVVPNGVDIDLFNPGNPPYPLTTKKTFKFLFVGGTIPRKGIDVLLDAYTKAFTSADDVCLVIKDMGGQTFYQGQTAKEAIGRISSEPGSPEIEYIEHTLDARELAGLYRACDCLVHPYRGEGFGLPIAEAMASGLPVIVTGYGAALDFCPEGITYLIPATEARLPEKRIGDLETVDFPWLAEPDRQGLERLMKHVSIHREEAAARGMQAAAFIRGKFTWEHAADVAMERIGLLKGKPVIRHLPAADPIEESSDIEELLRADEESFGQDDIRGAVALFRRVLKLDPKNAQALNNLGVIQWQLGETISAMGTFRIALTFHPEDQDALANLLQAARETGRLDLIDGALLDVLKGAQPENPDVEALCELTQGIREDA
jgi:glycosyltransferase involved in cell wall biosynthesis